jgi:hypothetical protein
MFPVTRRNQDLGPSAEGHCGNLRELNGIRHWLSARTRDVSEREQFSLQIGVQRLTFTILFVQ